MLVKQIIVAILVVIVSSAITWRNMNKYVEKGVIISATDEVLYEVETGSTLTRVAADLNSLHLVDYPKFLVIYARCNNLTAIKAGEYRITKGESLLGLLQRFGEGDVVKYQVTIPEGWNFKQVLAELKQKPKLAHKLNDLPDEKIIVELGLKIDSLEGRFFPDTYQYQPGSSDVELLLTAHNRMEAMLEKLWPTRATDLPYATPYEALIMASIVEKESGIATERPDIAGVFVERLRQGMRLQTDPTVIYGLGDAYDGNLKREQLKQPTPYNTYVNLGLPPTPIALPSEGAIAAALNPRIEGYLYFVAKGDGSHHFTRTLEEHLEAVKLYQITQRSKDYRSSPLVQ